MKHAHKHQHGIVLLLAIAEEYLISTNVHIKRVETLAGLSSFLLRFTSLNQRQRDTDMRRIPFFILVMVLVPSIVGPTHVVGLSATSPIGASLSLQPELVEVPLLDGPILPIELKVQEVQDLKEYHISFVYNTSILEYYGSKANDTFCTASGGLRGNEFNGVLGSAFTGSGIMFTYAFKIVQTGTTRIDFGNSTLVDESGKVMPFTAIGNMVRVLSLSEWIGGEFAELKREYDAIKWAYYVLSSSYDEIRGAFNTLKSAYDSLSTSFTEMKGDYAKIQENYAALRSNLESILNELGLTRSLTCLFLSTTVAFAIATIHFARKKGRAKTHI